MSQSSQPARTSVRKASSKGIKIMEVPQQKWQVPEHMELLNKLLDKFPEYETEWTELQKSKWLDGFLQFMQKIYPETKK
jgi:hypothetical protein